MNGYDESDEHLAQPYQEEEEERRHHLVDILERASAIHYSSPATAVTPNDGLNMTARRPATGNGFLGRDRERRDARTRLRRALLASSLGIPPRNANAARHVPQDDRQIPNEREDLTLDDLDRALNGTYDYRPNNAGDVDEQRYNGHYSAPQLTTTSSLLTDTDEDEERSQQQPPSLQTAGQAPPGQQELMTGGDRARLRTMLLRSLAVPSTSQVIAGAGHSAAHTTTGNPEHEDHDHQQHPPLPPHHVDATISLRSAIQRAYHDLVVLDDEFRRMCEAARSRRVDEDGNELQIDMEVVEEEGASSSLHQHQQEQQEQLANIVLPSSASAIARQASSFSSSSSSFHEDQQRSETKGEEQQEEQQDRSKARANADVAGTAILPLARKGTKRAQAA